VKIAELRDPEAVKGLWQSRDTQFQSGQGKVMRLNKLRIYRRGQGDPGHSGQRIRNKLPASNRSPAHTSV
jgi:hypothetical protein